MVGCCNSGTSILWHALRRHKELDGPETEGQDLEGLPKCMKHFLGRETFRMFAHPRFGLAYHLTEEHYDEAVATRLIDVYARRCEMGKRLIEKSPANSMRTRFLQRVFPDAYFVMIVRNAFAVAEGIVRKRLYDPERPHMAGLQTTIREAAEQWSHANRILLEDRSLLRRSILVKYEDLVIHTRDTMHSILRSCELGLDGFIIPKFMQDLNTIQIARLSFGERETVNAVASEMLGRLGYSAVDSCDL